MMSMASNGYYSHYQPAPYYYYNSQQQLPARGGGGGGGGTQRLPVHLFLLLATPFLLAASSLYARCESAVKSLLDQLRLFAILSPLLLIAAVQLWAVSTSAGGADRRGGGIAHVLAQLLVEDQDSYGEPSYGRWHRGGGGGAVGTSPWGVVVALVLVLFLVSYKSSFQNWWFPLNSR